MRGTFANVRLRNLLAPGTEGGVTRHLARRRADEHLRRRHALPGRRRPARGAGRAGSTARARRGTGRPRDRPSSGSGPSSPRASSGSTAPTWWGWGSSPCSSPTATLGAEPRPDRRGDLRHRRPRHLPRRRRAQGDHGARRRPSSSTPGCASTRPWRRSTSATAGSSPTFCASSPAETRPAPPRRYDWPPMPSPGAGHPCPTAAGPRLPGRGRRGGHRGRSPPPPDRAVPPRPAATASVVANAPVYDADAPDPDMIRVGNDVLRVHDGGKRRRTSRSCARPTSRLGTGRRRPAASCRRGRSRAARGHRGWSSSAASTSCTTPPRWRATGERVHLGGHVRRLRRAPSSTRLHGPLVCQPDLGGSIDPQPFVDPSGTPYLYWKSNGGPVLPLPAVIWAALLSPDGSSLASSPRGRAHPGPGVGVHRGGPRHGRRVGRLRPVLFGRRLERRRLRGRLRRLCRARSGPAPSRSSARSCTPTPPGSGPGGESLVPGRRGELVDGVPRLGRARPAHYSYSAGDFRSLWIAPVTFSGATPAVGAGEAPEGYHLSAQDGGVFAFGAAALRTGRWAGQRLDAPWSGRRADPATRRLLGGGRRRRRLRLRRRRLLRLDGGHPLAAPVVAMAATPDGRGYWLVGSDGGVFAFGDAGFYGSTGNTRLAKPVVGMAATPDGRGYWLVASDGGVFAFGDAAFYGSTGGVPLAQPVVGHGGHAPGRRLLAGGLRRRGLRLRRRPVLRLDRGHRARPARRGPDRRDRAAAATGWWRRTAGSSPSETPPFLGSMGAVALARPVVGAQSA